MKAARQAVDAEVLMSSSLSLAAPVITNDRGLAGWQEPPGAVSWDQGISWRLQWSARDLVVAKVGIHLQGGGQNGGRVRPLSKRSGHTEGLTSADCQPGCLGWDLCGARAALHRVGDEQHPRQHDSP